VSLKTRLTKLEAARKNQMVPADIVPAIEMSTDIRIARINRISTAAAQPEASPHLRRAGECLARMFVEGDPAKWIGELCKIGPPADPNEVEKLCVLAATRHGAFRTALASNSRLADGRTPTVVSDGQPDVSYDGKPR
jgi:hypothetical protein